LLFHGAYDFVADRGVEQVMGAQLQYSYFPVREAELKAAIEYRVLSPGQSVQMGSATVTAVMLNHTMINFGYRIDSHGKSTFFTGDHEPYYNIYDQADERYPEYQALIEEKERAIVEAARGVDVLIADASYTLEEYPAKKGWGHGTHDSCIDLAEKAGAKILYCTHHEPTRDDQALEQAFGKALARHPSRPGGVECRLAREGEEIEL
jgi:ribonuclease BN (tRNA processing enzyme)